MTNETIKMTAPNAVETYKVTVVTQMGLGDEMTFSTVAHKRDGSYRSTKAVRAAFAKRSKGKQWQIVDIQLVTVYVH